MIEFQAAPQRADYITEPGAFVSSGWRPVGYNLREAGMSKSTLHTDRSWIAAMVERPRRSGLLWLALACGAVIPVWQALNWSIHHSVWYVLGISVVAGMLLTLLGVRGSQALWPAYGWRHRLAFSAPPLLLTGYLIWQLTNHPAVWLAGLLAAGLGAFAGVIIAGGASASLWENNSPPSERVQQEVLARHREILGDLEPPGQAKRWFDIILAGLGLLLSSPVWIASAMLVWLEDPGPILFVKNSVGRGGGNFHQYKFRTMVRRAEAETGPVLAQADDQRVLAVGKILRKTALDELPQLINILRGEMSFVGPRPQRTVLVSGYLERLPEYAERHRVLPGLAGLAQVAGDYYLTPLQKLRFDRLYIRYSSLGFDVKLIILAGLITFYFRWQKGWNGRLPRRLLRWGSR